mmetsp:Transcript_33719/g.47041  ORF Transcript_33719/g.47041 Transcript_33719/m.47041 type:complete len:212 (-) Transcript_33719:171-806(-)
MRKHTSSCSKKRERKFVKAHTFSRSRDSNEDGFDDEGNDMNSDRGKRELARVRREFAELQQKVARLEKLERRRKAYNKKKAAVRGTSSNNSRLQIPESKKRYLDLSQEQKREMVKGIQSLSNEELMELAGLLFPGSEEEQVELDLETIDLEMHGTIQSFIGSRRHFGTPSETSSAPRSPRRIISSAPREAKECDSDSESDSESESSSDFER